MLVLRGGTLVDESHAHRRVMCRARGGRGLRLALEVGVESIEHRFERDRGTLERAKREDLVPVRR